MTYPRLAIAVAAAVAMAGAVAPAANPDADARERRERTQQSSSITPTTHSLHDPADAVLDRLLERRDPATRRGEATGGRDARAEGRGPEAAPGQVAPDLGRARLLREGTFVINRMGHVRRLDDGSLVFVFAADGEAPASAVDAPMRLVPNLNLMAVERAVSGDVDRRFRVTGRVTEYRGGNHLILEKVIVLN